MKVSDHVTINKSNKGILLYYFKNQAKRETMVVSCWQHYALLATLQTVGQQHLAYNTAALDDPLPCSFLTACGSTSPDRLRAPVHACREHGSAFETP
ncbi:MULTISPECIES: hypothetical protein [Cobetia]|uniref:hypothetical protein n=1 Tax=Cobetia TaxID=204286 RepID=UPI001582F06D|nr:MULTISPECIES: hypothetical protein [Cobetia]MDI4660100.1 hypothetical protein [Cobetia sp. BMC6]NUJ56315.1 hypothetical protein [Cobetia marina]